QSNYYDIQISGTSTAGVIVNTTLQLYPSQSMYVFSLPTNVYTQPVPTVPPEQSQILYSLSNTTGTENQTYTMTYQDLTSGTTALTFYIANTSGSWVASTNYTGLSANSQTFTQTEDNINGGSYTYGFYADQNVLGRISKYNVVTFPSVVSLFAGLWPT
ncbi:MAG: hypothetical protein PHV83_08210, partial [Bacteroidales bacterium]|nr:hypothetical protein [Bacteroidales bacterium]